MSDTTPSWPTPGPTPSGGDSPTQPVVTPPTEVNPTVPGAPDTPTPPTPASGGPTGPSGSKSGIPTPAFIVVLVLLVAALAFGIVSFLGKNSESDDKEKAEKELSQVQAELSSTQDELAALQEELTGSQQTGQALSDLVEQAAAAADSLKECSDASRAFASAFIDAVSGIVTTGEIPPELNDLAVSSDDLCATADESYDELIQIFAEINA